MQAELDKIYRSYVETVSPDSMAVSFETACMLLHLCRSTRATSVVDLGSGFSSCVLRIHASTSDQSVAVVSVDDQPEWLDRTAEFLNQHELDTGGLTTWADFGLRDPGDYDVVFHDLAGGDVREMAMPVAAANVAADGVILFDDAQHPGHRQRMYEVGAGAEFALYSLRRWTFDQYQRYALLGVRPGHR